MEATWKVSTRNSADAVFAAMENRSSRKHEEDGDHDCMVAGGAAHECDPMAASTVRQIHSIISSALNAAVRWGWIESVRRESPNVPSRRRHSRIRHRRPTRRWSELRKARKSRFAQLVGASERPSRPPAPGTVQAFQVAIAIVVNGPKVLIVCRRGDDAGGISWQFPAGIVKPGVSPESVAVRETLAETNVHCAVVRSLGSRLYPITTIHDRRRTTFRMGISAPALIVILGLVGVAVIAATVIIVNTANDPDWTNPHAAEPPPAHEIGGGNTKPNLIFETDPRRAGPQAAQDFVRAECLGDGVQVGAAGGTGQATRTSWEASRIEPG